MARFLEKHPEYRKLGRQRGCEWCGESFQVVQTHQRFCCRACQRASFREQARLDRAEQREVRESESQHRMEAVIEAQYQAALAAIKAERRHLTEDIIWAQPSSWHEHFHRNTPDTAGLYYLSPCASKPKGKHEPTRASR